MNFNPAAAVNVLINHNPHLNSSNSNSLHVNNNSIHHNNNNNSIGLSNHNNNSDIENFHQFDSPLTPLTNHSSKSMEWTNDDALELIEQYRGHTELWNRGDPKYKDKLCRFRAWSEIAERFGCSKAEVERKMNVLLTQYRREKHKMLVKLYQGITPSPSKWYAFKRFDFMEAGNSIVSSSSSGQAGSNRSRNDSTSSASGGGNTNTGLGDPGGIGGSGGGGTNGHTIAAAALNELRNFETTTSAVAAAAVASSSAAAAAAASTHHHPQPHRRFKSKEMKYFGAMGLNLPMLIANTQNLDTWNSVGQFSPPIGGADRGQLRVPLPMPFAAASASELGQLTNAPAHSIFGGGGGGSSSSDHTASPQKPMDTTDIDDERDMKHDQPQSLNNESKEKQQQQSDNASVGGNVGENAIGDEATGSGGSATGIPRASSVSANSGIERREGSSSPIPNTNTHEAHTSNRPTIVHPHHQPHPHLLHRLHDPRSDQEDLDIKEELVDSFHAPHPPAPPESHRSYSSTEERLCGGGGGGGGTGTDSDDFAQDLRISAAVAAAAKTLDFSRFVLPRNLRRSTDSNEDEKFTPLNMRKLSAASAGGLTPTSAASAVTNAGQMLMSSLLSHESLSEDASISGRGGGGAKSDASNSAAAAAAALYAESLNKDDCDFIGSNVSLKLRAMDRDQRIIAEKLISEVLFFGQFNELERTAHIQPK